MGVVDSYSENCGYSHICYVSAIHELLKQTLEGCKKSSAASNKKDNKERRKWLLLLLVGF